MIVNRWLLLSTTDFAIFIPTLGQLYMSMALRLPCIYQRASLVAHEAAFGERNVSRGTKSATCAKRGYNSDRTLLATLNCTPSHGRRLKTRFHSRNNTSNASCTRRS